MKTTYGLIYYAIWEKDAYDTNNGEPLEYGQTDFDTLRHLVEIHAKTQNVVAFVRPTEKIPERPIPAPWYLFMSIEEGK